jgi:hypothetical protein
MGEVHMDKGRVGEDRGSKEMDRCPLTDSKTRIICVISLLRLSWSSIFNNSTTSDVH